MNASAPRRGRPRSVPAPEGVEPSEEILRVAASLFSARGVGATRLADVAAAVGVSAPAIYYHYANLDAIVAELLAYVVEESAAFATAAASGAGSAAERLHALVTQHVARLTSGPYDLWFVAGMSDADGERFPTIGRHAARWRRAVASLVDEARDSGELDAVDTPLAVAGVIGLVYGALELRHRGGDVDPNRVADLALAAVAAPRRPGRAG